eukprot:14247647-Alexandrium_andersonii.AAC.1
MAACMVSGTFVTAGLQASTKRVRSFAVVGEHRELRCAIAYLCLRLLLLSERWHVSNARRIYGHRTRTGI